MTKPSWAINLINNDLQTLNINNANQQKLLNIIEITSDFSYTFLLVLFNISSYFYLTIERDRTLTILKLKYIMKHITNKHIFRNERLPFRRLYESVKKLQEMLTFFVIMCSLVYHFAEFYFSALKVWERIERKWCSYVTIFM